MIFSLHVRGLQTPRSAYIGTLPAGGLHIQEMRFIGFRNRSAGRRCRSGYMWRSYAMPTLARYGSWKSPITSELIVAQSIALSETRLDGDKCYWLEGRPQEQGRFVVVSSDAAGAAT